MNRPTAALVVVLLFLSGLVIGVMGTHLYYFYRLRGAAGPPARGAERVVGVIERDLALSPEQAREVRDIVERARWRAFELRRDTLPRMREIMETATEEIRRLLTAEQAARFDELRDRRRFWIEATLLGQGPQRPGPPGGHRWRHPGGRGPGGPPADRPAHQEPPADLPPPP